MKDAAAIVWNAVKVATLPYPVKGERGLIIIIKNSLLDVTA